MYIWMGKKIVNEELSVRNPNEVKKSFVLYSLIVGTHTFGLKLKMKMQQYHLKKVSITID